MEVYLVGGAVRDELLGLRVKERDWVVVGATPEEMEALGYKKVGKDFPVFLHPDTKEEYALARTERKTGPGYKGFEFHSTPDVTLEEDLARRDITINAMAKAADGRLIDPFGGKQDLENRRLRHVSSAFIEDPVRILRVARFAARFKKFGFKVAADTNDLMKEMVRNGEVDALVPERVWAELEKALAEDHPESFFQALRHCGALEHVFPEIDRLFGVPQTEKYHPEIDTGVHVMMVIQQAARLSQDKRVRFAAVVHDLGKGVTPEEEWPRHLEHEERGVEIIEDMCKRLAIPNEYRDLGIVVSRYHLHYHRAEEMRPGTFLKTLEGLDAFRRPERFEHFLLACEADSRGRKGFEDLHPPQTDIFKAVYHAAVQIQARPLVEQGLKGVAIKEELRRLRIHAIGEAIKDLQGDGGGEASPL